MPTIYHLIDQASWESARSTPEHQAESLATEGFIHCSENVDQMLKVANRLYSGRTDMLALEVDSQRLTSPVKREASRSGEIYPHIYGPLNTDAVIKVWSLPLDNDGKFSSVRV
ncbi:MAG TPA: DUF952 domain-containing protein [Dehalococcoidia bacterium]|nr:DUF952 domain-containing protein [Dehalococcoidia bacterium]